MASKLPTVTPTSKCLLRMRKDERIKDYLLMEECYIKSQQKNKTEQIFLRTRIVTKTTRMKESEERRYCS